VHNVEMLARKLPTTTSSITTMTLKELVNTKPIPVLKPSDQSIDETISYKSNKTTLWFDFTRINNKEVRVGQGATDTLVSPDHFLTMYNRINSNIFSGLGFAVKDSVKRDISIGFRC
jgi:hypothetical protein